VYVININLMLLFLLFAFDRDGKKFSKRQNDVHVEYYKVIIYYYVAFCRRNTCSFSLWLVLLPLCSSFLLVKCQKVISSGLSCFKLEIS